MRHTLSRFPLFVLLSAVSCRFIAPSPIEAQLTRGQAIYQKSCATTTCHGVNGEGIRSGNQYRDWPLVGDEFQSRNPTAQVIFDVVRSGGESTLRALTDQQIYDAIAYELSLNGVSFSEPLNAQNAPFIASGAAAGAQLPGSLFPPPGNARLVSTWNVPSLPASAESSDLRLRLTQIALAESIEGIEPADASRYILAVFTLGNLATNPLEVTPQHLSLVTQDGLLLEPDEVSIKYPVTRFYPQFIQPEHSTAALAIFVLPEASEIGYLRYSMPSGQQLNIELVP